MHHWRDSRVWVPDLSFRTSLINRRHLEIKLRSFQIIRLRASRWQWARNNQRRCYSEIAGACLIHRDANHPMSQNAQCINQISHHSIGSRWNIRGVYIKVWFERRGAQRRSCNTWPFLARTPWPWSITSVEFTHISRVAPAAFWNSLHPDSSAAGSLISW